MLKTFATAALALSCLTLAALAEPSNISAPDAQIATQSGDIVLIDVRRQSEWQATGMPSGATGITLQDSDFIAQVLARVDGDKSQPVALICRSGNRSSIAATRLEAAGFTNVQNVKEGMSGRRGAGIGWIARDLPVEAYADAD